MTLDPIGLPLQPLTTWLSSNLREFDSTTMPSAELLAGGRSNLTYKVTDATGRSWAIRRAPLGHIMPSAHDLSREFRVMKDLSGAQFPVPHPWALCEDNSIIGTPFLVMDYIDGFVVSDEQDAKSLTSAQADLACSLLIEGLVKLHSLDATAIGLGNFGKPNGYLERQVRRWGQQWDLSKTREQPQIDAISSWLNANLVGLPQHLPWSIVHGDYRLDNAILNNDFKSLMAIIDWEMSTLGDPVVDLAIALVYWTQSNDILRSHVPVASGVTSGLGFWSRDQVVDEYERKSGRDLSHLGFCLVFACYKLAIIMESLHFRQLSGHQLGKTADQGENMVLAVESLAELGMRLIEFPHVATLNS
jgi:aminoglycoside phosphotransferase (APT) family kinase protein